MDNGRISAHGITFSDQALLIWRNSVCRHKCDLLQQAMMGHIKLFDKANRGCGNSFVQDRPVANDCGFLQQPRGILRLAKGLARL